MEKKFLEDRRYDFEIMIIDRVQMARAITGLYGCTPDGIASALGHVPELGRTPE